MKRAAESELERAQQLWRHLCFSFSPSCFIGKDSNCCDIKGAWLRNLESLQA
jgi:hypothetical protein